MMAPPARALLAEIRGLGRREREELLSLLAPDERAHVERLLAISTAEAEPAPSFAALAGVSPWLLERIAKARDPGTGLATMTEAGRSALLKAEAALPRPAATAETRKRRAGFGLGSLGRLRGATP